MYDKTKLLIDPEEGSCTVNLDANAPIPGPREYIYNLLPHNKPHVLSKFPCLPRLRRGQALDKDNAMKDAMKTMGPPSKDYIEPVLPPSKRPYMKKQSKLPFIKQADIEKQRLGGRVVHDIDVEFEAGKADPKFRGGACIGRKPPIPNTVLGQGVGPDGIPLRCLKRRGIHNNWIVRNAIAAITEVPGGNSSPTSRRRIVDTRKGHRYPLKSKRTVSGLEPIYVNKPYFGRIPPYLIRRLEMIKKTQENMSRYYNEKALQNADYLLTPEQHSELLHGLKVAWERYNRKYLSLASINDTVKSKAYKVYLEKQMDTLEKDIQLVKTHPFLFVEAPKDPGTSDGIFNTLCV